ncbi:MAG: glycosyltransferase family 2 protein, partial [Wenzhouxiangella sp.]
MSHQPDLSVVVIGRNEGRRLENCLRSVQAADTGGLSMELIYVDSASSDGSPERAASLGARVLHVDPPRPAAAIGRNAGWRAARGQYVLFLDGDTLLERNFLPQACQEMATDPTIAAVWGHRREIATSASIYNRTLDLDWIYPPGDSEFCGGDALFRRQALETEHGYDDALIAGEEPELCARLRARGWRIRHIDCAMTGHDLAMTRFGQYWRRAERAGHAYADVAHRLADSPVGLWQDECRRNARRMAIFAAGGVVLLAALLSATWWLMLALAGLALILVLRSAWRARWKKASPGTLLAYALHSHLQQVPIFWGQMRWRLDRYRGRQRQLIEYKGPGEPLNNSARSAFWSERPQIG